MSFEDWLIDQNSNSEPSTALFTLTEHTSATTSIAFSPDGKQLGFGGDNSTVNIRDIYSGQQKLTLPGHTISVNQVKFSPDGKFIATADQVGQIRLWNAADGALFLHHVGAKHREKLPTGEVVESALIEFAKLAALLLCMLSLYAIFRTLFLSVENPRPILQSPRK